MTMRTTYAVYGKRTHHWDHGKRNWLPLRRPQWVLLMLCRTAERAEKVKGHAQRARFKQHGFINFPDPPLYDEVQIVTETVNIKETA